VRSFFLSQIRFWLEQYHIDGFSLDINDYGFYQLLLDELPLEYSSTLLLVSASDFSLTIDRQQLHQLFHGNVDNPFETLGAHELPDHDKASVRAILPDAQQAYLYFSKQPHVWFELHQRHGDGFWEAIIPLLNINQPYKLLIVEKNRYQYETEDIYAKGFSLISENDKSLFTQGNHYRIHEKLGAHPYSHEGIKGVNFAVWAPNAAAVSIVGSFNHWHGAGHLMKRLGQSGIWELFVPAISAGDLYKFNIRQHTGNSHLKSDPYAFYMETAPATASIVYQLENLYQWHDHDWLEQRGQSIPWHSPISVYEVHLASWKRNPDNSHLSYKEISQRLIPYVKEMGFTHIEVLPIAEHPYEPSWGYQVSNFYAPTSRLGKPEELMYFIDQCHQQDIGVILDWVAGHFPKDAHALAQFDGTHLFEHADPKQGEHKDWGTLIFNYGRHEVENFLIANALFWLEKYHFDGLRVDAVASMLYLDYSREPGEWVPNIFGCNENLEAIEFLKHTNAVVHEKFPGVLMIAEESTAWPGVSRPTDTGGLGFGFKWNMGWMHDVLNYMQTPPKYRSLHHHQLVFIFQYAFDENYILSLSHDEVVHLKGSLFKKMPGTEWEKYANLRLLFFFMFTHPGKKLNFMGAEFAQSEEWNEGCELQWQLLKNKPHQRLKCYQQSLNHLYCSEGALYEMDCRPVGFAWIDADNNEQSIIAFMRKAREPRNAVIVVINFSEISRFKFRLGVPFPVTYTQLFNSNDESFGGFGPTVAEKIFQIQEIPWHGQEFSLEIDLPALSGILLKPAPVGS
jgi:1,4-alpha-glucan branching enzyme